VAKAVALKEAMEPAFKVYQQQVAKNAKAMVEVFLEPWLQSGVWR
jgi:glycine hydroxymethyltransferase